MPIEKKIQQSFDVVVIGGGLAGICAAIAAARHGCAVALVQDRPVLGGNSSSEIRVNVSGAGNHHKNARETGILEELRIEDRYLNHEPNKNGRISSIWDMVLFEWVKREPNIMLYLNTSARHAVMKDEHRIGAIVAEQVSTEYTLTLSAPIFIDASGDGRVAADAGAEYRVGREARGEFNEDMAPEKADHITLGSSLMFRARDMGRPVAFVPPEWAADYPTDDDLPFRTHTDINSGYWWIEWGGTALDTIDDNDKIRDDLLCFLYGVWDHIKNHGDHGAENYAFDWIGMVPGKRESRRFMGDHILTESDILNQELFSDRVAYGGWPIDLHAAGGITSADKPATFKRFSGIYSIPFRCLYSRNINNLMMAGRNISATHVAFGSTRVMPTCAIEGQAVGTAAHLCKEHNTAPRGIYQKHISELQQLLLKDDCYIIALKNEDPADLARGAHVTASSNAGPEYAVENIVNGVSRPEGDSQNLWVSDPAQPLPQHIELDLGSEKTVNGIYLTFDTQLGTLVEPGVMPECVKDYTVQYLKGNSWVKVAEERGNYHRRRIHRFKPVAARRLRVEVLATNGCPSARIYEVRVYNEP